MVLERPIQSYCYSNIDEFSNQWYRWFKKLLNESVPQVTTQRAILPPWISKERSPHLIKNLDTLQRKIRKNNNQATLSKNIQMNNEISKTTTEDQLEYETGGFTTKKFNKTQGFLRTANTAPPYPNEMFHGQNRATDNLNKAKLFN